MPMKFKGKQADRRAPREMTPEELAALRSDAKEMATSHAVALKLAGLAPEGDHFQFPWCTSCRSISGCYPGAHTTVVRNLYTGPRKRFTIPEGPRFLEPDCANGPILI